MSRYYEIAITAPGATAPLRIWTSQPNGVYDPGAWDVEFDVLAYDFAHPMGLSTLTIQGPSIQDLNQQISYAGKIYKTFSGMTITLKGGMQKGLPLANPKQAGILTSGTIYQSFGNWEGTEQTLDFVIAPSPATFQQPANFVFQWTAGTPIAYALKNLLGTVYPGYALNINVNPNLVLNHSEVHYCGTLQQFAQYVQAFTKARGQTMFGPTYPGVFIAITGGNTISCFDNTPPASLPVPISFNDLIGQPTWIAVDVMQMKLVMRADLSVGTYVTMPPKLIPGAGTIISQAASLPSYNKNNATFQGLFKVIAQRHIGHFRGSDASNWATVVNCQFIPAGLS